MIISYSNLGRTDSIRVELLRENKIIDGSFTNARIDKKTLPADIYAYDFREGDNGDFCSLEPSVTVNHGGTFLTEEKIDFRDKKFLDFGKDFDYSF